MRHRQPTPSSGETANLVEAQPTMAACSRGGGGGSAVAR